MADSQHKYLLERGWSQQQIDEVIRKAHEWLRGAGYTPLTEQGHWNGIMGSTQSYHLPSREKDARGMTEAFVEMLKGGKILDASRVHKFSRPGEKDMMASENEVRLQLKGGRSIKIIRTETPTGGMWSIPEMPEIAAHQNISVIRDRLRGKGLIASRTGANSPFKVEDRFYFGKGRKERFWARGYDDAKDRVRRSPELGKYAKIIMQPEFDTADHWEWVSRASTSEIVNWAKSISRDM
jgi:hypothetical protein